MPAEVLYGGIKPLIAYEPNGIRIEVI